jgi:hypothetical protein
VTEVEYFEGIKDHFRAIPVVIGSCAVEGVGRDPLRVVHEAVKCRDRAAEAARRRGDAFLAYDEVWAVVDVDDHASLDQAIKEARDRDVKLVISFPCFEIWLLWHFQDCPAALSARAVHDKLSRHIPGYGKRLPGDFPYGRHVTARQRAERADPEHALPGRKGGNPSSNVWLVVEAISSSGKV